MKKCYIFVLSLLILIMIAFSGCDHGSCGQEAYFIGKKYSFIDSDILVTLDEEEQQFIFEYTDKDPSASLYFNVSFTYHTITTLRNSSEFTYTDMDGNELVFDENGYYVCNGDQIFYISYKNASDEIKTAIAESEFNISFDIGPFIKSNAN